ncbi:MAG: CDP-glycerol glycerophosphotransferase family protein [Alphaproteobacteria bacterium]
MIKFLVEIILSFWAILFGRIFRNNDLVVVVNCHNNFTGNCKYAVMEIQKKFPNKKIVWGVETPQQQKSFKNNTNIKVYLISEINFKFYITFAKYVLSDGGFIGKLLVNGCTFVDFNHGINLKKIGYDALEEKMSIVKKIRNYFNRNNFIQSGGSLHDATVTANAWRLNSEMIKPLGTPSISPLVNKKVLQQEINKDQQLKKVQNETKKYTKTFLYAPTYRDSGSYFLKNLNFDIKKLNQICKNKNVLFLIKMHPLCSLNIKEQYGNVKILDKTYDGVLCVGLSDVIISDYSSMYHHGLVANKELILMHGDLNDYINNNRDIYTEELEKIKGHKINNFDDLCDMIDKNTKIRKAPEKTKDLYFDKANVENPYRFLKVFK